MDGDDHQDSRRRRAGGGRDGAAPHGWRIWLKCSSPLAEIIQDRLRRRV
jgi:hypothetical protein